MLQTVDRLPIPNKTIVQESRFFPIVERWLSAEAPEPQDDAGEARSGVRCRSLSLSLAVSVPPRCNSEYCVAGLPADPPDRPPQDGAASADKTKDNAAALEKVKDLSNQLLERWSSLKVYVAFSII